MIEIWKPIPNLPDYEVSNLGQIKSLARLVWRGPIGYCLKKEIIRKLVPDGNGYLMFTAGVPKKSYYVHIIVAVAFFGPCPNRQEVRHLNGDRSNPRLDNLVYGTRKQNIEDAYIHGTRSHQKNKDRSQKATKTKLAKYGSQYAALGFAGVEYSRLYDL